MVAAPGRGMGSMVNLFQRGAAATERIFEILDVEPEIADRPAPGVPAVLAGAIRVDDLSYVYPGASPAGALPAGAEHAADSTMIMLRVTQRVASVLIVTLASLCRDHRLTGEHQTMGQWSPETGSGYAAPALPTRAP